MDGLRWSTLLLVASLGLASSCTSEEPDTPSEPVTFEGLVEDHRGGIEGTLTDCGSVDLSANECSMELSSQEQCLWDAFNACELAELELILPTTDAGPLPTHLFVRMGNYGCEIDLFTDHSNDGFKGDYGDFTHDACTQLQGDLPDPEACDQLLPLECERVDEWWAD